MKHPLSAALILGLAGCSLLAGGQASLVPDPKSPTPPGEVGGKTAEPIAGPRLAQAADDPPHISAAIDRLKQMEKMIGASQWREYARESASFHHALLPGGSFDDSDRKPDLAQRLGALDATAFKAFERVQRLVGDGVRISEGIAADDVEVVDQAIDACQAAAKTTPTSRSAAAGELKQAIAAYEKQIARVLKVNPKLFVFHGDASGGRYIDVPTALLACEAQLAESSTELADQYVPDVASGKVATEKGCGRIQWTASGVAIGGGKFAPYEGSSGGEPHKMPCKKMPTKKKYGKAVASAVAVFERDIKKAVTIAKGSPTVAEFEGRLHRMQEMETYGHDIELDSNPCGEMNLFCEAGGSRGATGFNRLEHYLDRATFHAGRDAERCKAHLKSAKQEADDFAKLHEELVASGEWVSGATYKTKKGARLKEKAFIAAFAQKGELADERLLSKYCSARPTTP